MANTIPEKTLPYPPQDGGDVSVETETATKPQLKPYVPWSQQWEELGQRSSGESYNPYENRADRLFQATRNFNEGRFWPFKDRHVRDSWDQWLLYIGILNIIPVWRPKHEEEYENDDEDDEIEDGLPTFSHQRKVTMSTKAGEKAPPPRNNRNQGERREFKKRRPRPPYVNDLGAPPVVGSSEEIQQLLQDSKDRKADRINVFLNDPAKRVQVFLSSYMTKQGFIFMERNLTLYPRLLRFYVNFLLKDGVFASEPEIESSLHQALCIIDLAQSELPLTAQISKLFPKDKFSVGCEASASFGVQQKDELLFQALIQKTLAASMTEVPSTDSGLTLEELVDNKTLHISDESPIEIGDLVTTATTDITVDACEDSSNDVEDWGTNDTLVDPWLSGPPPTLLLFGPIAVTLPETHTSGVVESSMRRVTSIVHPVDPLVLLETEVDNSRSPPAEAEAVEADLSARLSKVVMEPWPGWDVYDSEATATVPQIMGSSRGRVVVYPKDNDHDQVVYAFDSDKKSNSFGALSSCDGDVPVHDPLKHAVTILVEPECAQMLKVGMGLEGTWVQIARKEDLILGNEEERLEGSGNWNDRQPMSTPMRNENNSAFGQSQRFWYLTKLLTVLPSYSLP